MNEAYEKLKAKGYDMSWYENRKNKRPAKDDEPAPLHTDNCCRLSIYLLDPKGDLYTVTGTGKQYMWVRKFNAKPKEAIYMCACCRKQFKTHKEAFKHSEREKQ